MQPLEGVQAARQGSGQLPRAGSTQKGGGRAGWIRRAHAGSGRARGAENLETCSDRASPPTTTALMADTRGAGMHGAPGVSGWTPGRSGTAWPREEAWGETLQGLTSPAVLCGSNSLPWGILSTDPYIPLSGYTSETQT